MIKNKKLLDQLYLMTKVHNQAENKIINRMNIKKINLKVIKKIIVKVLTIKALHWIIKTAKVKIQKIAL